jgi:hypothetical protein
MKNRFEIIQYLIDTYNYKSYLEIGVRYAAESDNISISTIKCDLKVGVDIENKAATFVMSSDKYFSTINKSQKFDIIFIDGDHEKTQVHKDILNALNHLSPNGLIVCHDVNPFAERQLHPTKCHNAWETWAMLRQTRADLQMHALNIDMVGIIRKGSQVLYTSDIEYTWQYLDKNRKELLNVIDEHTFKQIYHN